MPVAAGSGVVSAWPKDGDLDVPVRSPLVLQFSSAPSLALIDSPCVAMSQVPTGRLCLQGPTGFVEGDATVKGNTLTFAPKTPLQEGAEYRVLVSPAVLEGATNVPAEKPLVSFRARSERPKAKTAAIVLALNGQAPETPRASSDYTVLDVDSLRLLFSEPLGLDTVISDNVTLEELLPDGTSARVQAGLLCDGIHLTVDPQQDLDAARKYRLVLGPNLKDFGRELAKPTVFDLKVIRTSDENGRRYDQVLAVDPPWTPSGTPPASAVAALPANTGEVFSPLIGSSSVGLFGPTIFAQLGEPKSLGGPIPLVIRKGQRLDLSGLDIRFAGILPTGRKTSTQHLTFLNDAVGFLARNPLRAPTQLPDDEQAPVAVDLVLDAALTAEDLDGNILSNQTVMGIVLHGTSRIDGKRFAVDQFSSIEFNALGIGKASVNMSLRLRTDAPVAMDALAPPKLVSSYPTEGEKNVLPDTEIQFNFSQGLDGSALESGRQVLVSQQGRPVDCAIRTNGATLLIKPKALLATQGLVEVTLSGLQAITGEPVDSNPALKLSFSVAANSAAPSVAPYVLSSVPGAPCALTLGTPGSPGVCSGGDSKDSPYQPFTLPANRRIEVQFSQSIDPATVALGQSCGQGSVRIESTDAQGKCLESVAGTLSISERSFTFVPNVPWLPSVKYHLRLVTGDDDRCGPQEICSKAQKPLNGDVLRGVGAQNGGGPLIDIPFQSEPSTQASFLPLSTWPRADLNANGVVDVEETPNEVNRAAIELASFGGIISSAALAGPDCDATRPGIQNCISLTASLPVSVGSAIEKCPIDGQGQPTTKGEPCVEVRVFPNLILGTEVVINTTALGLIPIDKLSTGTLVMRILEPAQALKGYIVSEPDKSAPQFIIRQDLLLDAPDLRILGGAVSSDLKSKALPVAFKGPVTFLPDGRMQVALKSLNEANIKVNVRTLFLTGSLDLKIPAGEMKLNLLGPLVR